jgi:hypothetical protein
MGTVGMVKTSSGIRSEVLYPGYHPCWGRDRLYLAPLSLMDKKYGNMAVTAKDRVRVSFDVRLTVRIGDQVKKKPASLSNLFMKQGQYLKEYSSKGHVLILSKNQLVNIYITPLIRSLARDVVGSVTSDKAMLLRKHLRDRIEAGLRKRLSSTPLVLNSLGLTNLRIQSKVVNSAYERAKEREVAVQQAKQEVKVAMEKEMARNKVEVQRIKNQMILAEKKKQLRALKGEAEAAYYTALEKAVGDKSFYLRIIALENQERLIRKMRPRVTIFSGLQGKDGGSMMPFMRIPFPKKPLTTSSK